MGIVVDLDHVSFGYDRRPVLTDVSFRLESGLTFLVGENGAGKTTLFKLLLGELKAKKGVVSVLGVPVRSRAGRHSRSQIGYLPQSFGVPQDMRVLDFVRYCGWLRGMAASDLTAAASRSLDRVGLGGHRRDRLGELSGGMLRRCGIAQAIVHDPVLLMLDEPSVGLDPTNRIEMRRLLVELAETASVITSTHLLEDVTLTGGHLVIMDAGRPAYAGSVEEFLKAAEATTGTVPTFASALEGAYLSLRGLHTDKETA